MLSSSSYIVKKQSRINFECFLDRDRSGSYLNKKLASSFHQNVCQNHYILLSLSLLSHKKSLVFKKIGPQKLSWKQFHKLHYISNNKRCARKVFSHSYKIVSFEECLLVLGQLRHRSSQKVKWCNKIATSGMVAHIPN